MPTGAELLVTCLENEGVERIFGIPGEETTALLGALESSTIDFVPVRHEQSAAFVGEVHGRLTGEPGVCLGTLGPGATNLVTGVADAELNRSPVVAITGQLARPGYLQESHQVLDIVSMFRPITKWNGRLDGPALVPEGVQKAFAVARQEPPGATHIEFPADVATETVDEKPITARRGTSLPMPGDEALAAITRIVGRAERPLLLAGYGVHRTGAAAAVRRFVDATGIPVLTTYMGKGALSDRHEASLMTLATHTGLDLDNPVEAADCVIAAGYDVVEHDPMDWNADRTEIVHLGLESVEGYREYDPAAAAIGDLGVALDHLAAELEGPSSDWYKTHRETVWTEVRRPPDGAFSVAGAVPIVRDVLDEGDVLVCDVGHHKEVLSQRYPTYAPNGFVVSNGLASMGFAVPGAIGADLAVDTNVLAATGDGGFLMNAAEIETARRLSCGLTILVFNDRAFGSIARHQRADVDTTYGTDLENPDFTTFAESFGIAAQRPTTWDDLADVLAGAVSADELTLVEVPIERTEP